GRGAWGEDTGWLAGRSVGRSVARWRGLAVAGRAALVGWPAGWLAGTPWADPRFWGGGCLLAGVSWRGIFRPTAYPPVCHGALWRRRGVPPAGWLVCRAEAGSAAWGWRRRQAWRERGSVRGGLREPGDFQG